MLRSQSASTGIQADLPLSASTHFSLIITILVPFLVPCPAFTRVSSLKGPLLHAGGSLWGPSIQSGSAETMKSSYLALVISARKYCGCSFPWEGSLGGIELEKVSHGCGGFYCLYFCCRHVLAPCFR